MGWVGVCLSALTFSFLSALLIAVSTAVDKVIAHFSSARNLVQKAQLGDSWLSPDVGYLLLHTLCPALYGLVEDGLKPFQKDVITGQRRNSPWSVVEASVKTGRCGEMFGTSTSECLEPFSCLATGWGGFGPRAVILCMLCITQAPTPALSTTCAGVWPGWPLSAAPGRSFMPLFLAF
uniref:Uncharacterized protein n=1 Tax=Phasianus colchicus TaxID=9054 RepID=A0A669QP41_PHACC